MGTRWQQPAHTEGQEEHPGESTPLNYARANEAKADFDDVYNAPTPQAYMEEMAQHNYEIGEQAQPYCMAAVELLQRRAHSPQQVQMLDIGCSYGMGAAFVKHARSFQELKNFFAPAAGHPAEQDFTSLCRATRNWIHSKPPAYDMRCIGLDSSPSALHFAVQAGLLDHGISQDLERPGSTLSLQQRRLLQDCNLVISTGAIGYITARTLLKLLPHIGKNYAAGPGPFILFTILRMFDTTPIQAAFTRCGLHFETVPGILLPQRNFSDAAEQNDVLQLLRKKGVDVRGYEDQGKQYASLCVAAPPEHTPHLQTEMQKVHNQHTKAHHAAKRS